jgi:ribosomal protein S8E
MGDPVLSVDHGRVVVVPIAGVRKSPAPNHYVVHVELANGAVLEISARHPTADGRTFGDLRAGGELGGVVIARATVVPYVHDATYDILPASDSGTYFAGGVLIGSTLGGAALSSRGEDYSAMSMVP